MEQGKNNLTEFLKGSGILVLSNVCLKAINFFLLPLYTKYLSPDQLGISDSITNLTSFILPLLTLGLDSAFSAFYFEKNEEDRGKRVYSTLAVTFFFMGIIALLLACFSGGISNVLFHTGGYSHLVVMAFGCVTVNLWYLPLSLELRMKNRMFFFGLANVLASLSMILLNILFVAVFRMGEESLVISSLLSNLFQLLLLMFFVKRAPAKDEIDTALLRKMVKYGLPLVPMSVLNWILALSDRYVLLHFHGEGTVGVYGIAMRFVTVLNVVISAIAMAYTTFAFQVKDSDKAKRQYYYVFQVESFLLLGMCFTVTLFGPEVIRLMSSDEAYYNASEPLRDLLFAQAVFAMSGVIGYGINFAKKSGYYLLAVSAGAAVNLGLNLVLIPEFGMKAAAATTLLGYIIVFVLVSIFSKRLYPCHYGILRAGAVTAALYLICFFTGELNPWLRLIIWAASVAAGIFIYRDILKKLVHFLRSQVFHRG